MNDKQPTIRIAYIARYQDYTYTMNNIVRRRSAIEE